jgi:hypothetical protein
VIKEKSIFHRFIGDLIQNLSLAVARKKAGEENAKQIRREKHCTCALRRKEEVVERAREM